MHIKILCKITINFPSKKFKTAPDSERGFYSLLI